MTRKLIALAIVFILATVIAPAEQVPGTSVSLTPPDGFKTTDRFPGFVNEESGASIMVTEIPGSFKELIAGFSDKTRMQAQGMSFMSKSPHTTDGHEGMLFQFEQAAQDTLFRKWLLAIDYSDKTILVVATYPAAETVLEEPLKTSLLSTTLHEATDPADALGFMVTPASPLKVAKVYGQNMILTPEGRFPQQSEILPFMILGLSISEGLSIPDQKAFSEQRATQIATVKSIKLDRTVPITIKTMSGYTTTAAGIHSASAKPVTIYQVLLFDESGYCLIQGITPTNKADTFLPLFERTAKTFRMKE